MSEPAAEQTVESALFEAWDEMQPPPESSSDGEVEVETDEAEEAEEVAGEEDTTEEADDEESEDEEEDEEGTGDVEPETVSLSTSDPALLAYLARYDNDPEKALKAAVELQRVLTRQGTEKNRALARVKELEDELEQAQMFGAQQTWLTPEQQEYVQSAVASEQPQAWVQQAVRAGEFELARAIVDEWAENQPYPALRVAQWLDRVEEQAASAPQADSFDRNQLVQQLGDAVPDMARYEPQMVAAINQLGPKHPLVIAAKHGNEQETVNAIVSLYEIAKASASSVAQTKARVKQDQRKAAVDARQAAVVQSGTASPSGGQTPRKIMIAPGLSLEDLDAEFARHQ